LSIDHDQGLVGQCMGQAGLGDRPREGTQHCIGQGDLRAATQAAVERIERCFDAQPAHKAADDGTRDQAITTCTRDRLSTNMMPTAAITAFIITTS